VRLRVRLLSVRVVSGRGLPVPVGAFRTRGGLPYPGPATRAPARQLAPRPGNSRPRPTPGAAARHLAPRFQYLAGTPLLTVPARVRTRAGGGVMTS